MGDKNISKNQAFKKIVKNPKLSNESYLFDKVPTILFVPCKHGDFFVLTAMDDPLELLERKILECQTFSSLNDQETGILETKLQLVKEENIFSELGKQMVELYIILFLFETKIKPAYCEAEALIIQTQLLKEEEDSRINAKGIRKKLLRRKEKKRTPRQEFSRQQLE